MEKMITYEMNVSVHDIKTIEAAAALCKLIEDFITDQPILNTALEGAWISRGVRTETSGIGK